MTVGGGACPRAASEGLGPVTELPGVGPVRAERLARLGLRTIRDVLLFVPRRLERRGPRLTACAAREALGEKVSVVGLVGSLRFHRSRGRRSLLRVRLEDGTGSIDALFFNQPWLREIVAAHRDGAREVELHGRVVGTKAGPALASPRIGTDESPLPEPGTIAPLYPSTEGLGQGFLAGICRRAVRDHLERLEEPLGGATLDRLGLPPLPQAVRELHLPKSEAGFLRARRRVALEPILALQARIARRRARRARGQARAIRVPPPTEGAILARFPFEPTAGQRRVMGEIAADLARTRPMCRLLQGDVGSGKTLVGLHACMVVAEAGGQSVLMAPTELLAEQHYYGLLALVGGSDLRPALLTGSLPAAERRDVLRRVADGSAALVVGTHALFSSDVRYRRLDLAVIDEQQRFGVAQRRRLLEKGEDVHVLLMTATPIPRTLALTLYGDLEVSLLEEKPPGRGGLETRVVHGGNRAECLELLGERLEAGERVFWVTPRIATGEDEDVAAAEATHARLERGDLARHGVELVHGRLPRGERERRLDRFRSGRCGLLVGTTVIEVGVDVPEATVMVIEGAERFGLAQLHQLRGRVGRGPRPSICLLLGKPSAAERYAILERTDDGFAIAEEDLRRRGMGDLGGLRQAGESSEGLDDPWTDVDLLVFARDAIESDPLLAERYLRAALQTEG